MQGVSEQRLPFEGKEGRKKGASEEGQLEYDLRSLGSNHASKSAGEGRGERDDDDNDAGRKGCSEDF